LVGAPACKLKVCYSNPCGGDFFNLFRPLVKCSSSTPRELKGQRSLETERVVDRPVEFKELIGML